MKGSDIISRAMQHLDRTLLEEDRNREAILALQQLWTAAVNQEWVDKRDRQEVNAYRRAARKYGTAVGSLIRWADPRTGLIDESDIPRIVKFARDAASNAFAAHPTLRAE